MSNTLALPPIVNTTQDAVGRATIVAFPDYNMMVWNGTDSAHTLNMAQCAHGNAVFPGHATVIAGFSSTAANVDRLVNGPCFVVAPSGTEGYVVCVNQNATVLACPTKMQPGSNPYFWGLVDGMRSVTGSKAAGAPAAALGLQNGRLMLNIVWQDAGTGGMVLAQMLVGDAQATLSFKPLGEACIGQPSLVMQGNISFLAWTGLDNSFNLAIDPTGGVDFRFDDKMVDASRSSQYGPCLVPFNKTQLYVLWTGTGGIQYGQLAQNQFGQWGFNPAAGCSGIVPNSGNSLGGPYGHRDDAVDEDGGMSPALAVAWPNNTTSVMVTNVPVSLAPVPIQQVALG